MEFIVSHGVYNEEKLLSQKFMINIDLVTDFKHAAINDTIEDTLNYEDIYKLCDKIVHQPVNLIEHLAHKIANKIKTSFKKVISVEIEIQKKEVQLGGKLDYVSVIYRLD